MSGNPHWTPLEESLWSATAPPAPDCPALPGAVDTDIAIVGAGYCGLSAALHLAERGHDVTVLEAHEPGWGASGRNAGHCTPDWTYNTPDGVTASYGTDYGERLNDLQSGAGALVFELIERHGIDCDARQTGTVSVVRKGNDKALAACRAKAEQWTRRGKAVEMLDEAGVSAQVGSDRFQAALMFHEGGNLQPLAFSRGLAVAAQKAGAAVHGHTAVTGIHRDGSARGGNGGWRLTTAHGDVRARKVLLATNAHRSGLWPGLDSAYYPVASALGATPPVAPDIRDRMLPHGQSFAELGSGFFFFFDAAGRLIIGGGGGLGVNNNARDSAAWLGRRLNGVFPYLGPISFDYFWNGWLDVSPTRLPGLHELADGLYAAVGFSGRGVPTATAMGREAAQFLATGDAGAIAFPITPLPRARFNRLGQWLAANVIIPWDRFTARID
jgi:glycine/D-amino acid oxidase-like deaminating enzyme